MNPSLTALDTILNHYQSYQPCVLLVSYVTNGSQGVLGGKKGEFINKNIPRPWLLKTRLSFCGHFVNIIGMYLVNNEPVFHSIGYLLNH